MSKRDDDSASDMDVGMTTAERRRRRRRGGGLRVPSDNVPRRSTTPPVVAPVPEDPSLAMSIAYSFTNEASEPIPRVEPESAQDSVPTFDSGDPIAPDGMPTVIDPVSGPVEDASFEMKTREMSAVDLRALGLEDPASSNATVPMQRISSPGIEPVEPIVRFKPQRTAVDPSPPEHKSVDVDLDAEGGVTLDTNPPNAAVTRTISALEPAPPTPPVLPKRPTDPPPLTRSRGTTEPGALADRLASAGKQIADEQDKKAAPRERLRTMALSDDDLEEVRDAVRAATGQEAKAVANVVERATAKTTEPPTNRTQPLSILDVEPLRDGDDNDKPEPLSVPEIDINDLAERADSSGEFEVDVEDVPLRPMPQVAAVTPPPPAPTGDRRSRPPSAPPPPTPHHTAPPATPPAGSPPVAASAGAHASPPPPPAHKAPPAPPKTKTAAAVAAVVAPKPEGKGAPTRGKPWFVDLFDEDYLRTLPFLTPQATQSEAEFVIEAMGLQPGAQVLDVGCGYGRHAMELAARGFHVVGLDLSTPLLVRGGEEAQRRGLEINFVRGDMRELDFEAQFDGAYCLFSTFGYFDDETNKKTISNIARALKPGGRVMLEILNRDYVIADLPTRVWWEGDGCVVLEEVELNYFSSRIQVNRSVVFDDGRQLEQEISVRAYSLHEVGKLMHAAGFRVLEVSGGYHTRGRFFGNQSRHIIVLAERKDPSAL